VQSPAIAHKSAKVARRRRGRIRDGEHSALLSIVERFDEMSLLGRASTSVDKALKHSNFSVSSHRSSRDPRSRVRGRRTAVDSARRLTSPIVHLLLVNLPTSRDEITKDTLDSSACLGARRRAESALNIGTGITVTSDGRWHPSARVIPRSGDARRGTAMTR